MTRTQHQWSVVRCQLLLVSCSFWWSGTTKARGRRPFFGGGLVFARYHISRRSNRRAILRRLIVALHWSWGQVLPLDNSNDSRNPQLPPVSVANVGREEQCPIAIGQVQRV